MGRRVCNPKGKVTGGRGDPGVGAKEAEIQGDGEQRKIREKALWKVKEGSGVSRNSYKEREREKGRQRGEERGDSQERTTVERNRRELNRLMGSNTPSWRKKGPRSG